MLLQLRYFLVAVQFFTRIPITGALAKWMGFETSWISRCTRFFPLIGLLLGIALGVLFKALHLVFDQTISVILTTIIGILATGAFHEDGFADFCDGFGGGQTPERIITIMRDSRVGAYGAIAIALMLITKIQLLASLDPLWVGAALVVGHSASRGFAVLIMMLLPYVETSAGNKLDSCSAVKPVAAGLQIGDWVPALVFGFGPAIAVAWMTDSWLAMICGLLFSAAISAWMFWTLRRRLGGYTGDTLGATQQLSEVFFYLGCLANGAAYL